MLLKGKHIFAVEDNVHNRVILKMIPVYQGATVEFDRWGRDALWRLQAFGNVDLIILDLMLPGGYSGYDIFDEIRTPPGYDRVPIVAVSAAEPALAIPRTQGKGFAGFIVKPVDDELFPQQIARILAGEQVWYAGERFHGATQLPGEGEQSPDRNSRYCWTSLL